MNENEIPRLPARDLIFKTYSKKLKARIESSVNVRGRITATQKFLRRFNSAYLYETADGEGNTATISIFNNIDAP